MTLTHLSLQFPYSDDFPNLGNNTLFGSNLTVLIWFCCRTAAAALTRCRPAKCRAVQQRPLSGSPCCAARLRPVRLLCPWSCSTTRPRPAAPTTPSWWQRISSCWRLASPLRWGRGTRWSFCFLWITAGSQLDLLCVQGSELKPGEMPAGWRSVGGVYRLQYTHPLCENSLVSVVAVGMGPLLVLNGNFTLLLLF